ncbi:MAG TPA: hypothetical protein VNE40_03100 [Candidatus Dormibacteraeota bacterium]|nr:hypothetical protein [Candidatus Dormibacteraeota bacterium]
MITRSREAAPGQIAIPGLEPRLSLVHILTPEYMGVRAEDYADVPAAWVEWAAPEHLRPSLIDIAWDDRSAVGYKPAGSNRRTWLAVTPEEYQMFARDVSWLARTAINGTLNARARTISPFAEVNQLAAQRAGIHAVESRSETMQTYLAHIVEPRIKQIDRFKESTEYPNLNRGNNQKVRQRFEYLQQFVIGDMLRAIGNQRAWTTESGKPKRAEQAITKRLYIDGSPSQRAANFRDLLELAGDYYGHKKALLLTKIWESKKYIKDNSASD